MKKIATLLITFSLFLIGNLSAQLQGPLVEYVPGEMFVKIKANTLQSPPSWNHLEEATSLIGSELSDLYVIAQTYEIHTWTKAFRLAGEELDLIYNITFSPTSQNEQLLKALSALPYIEYAERISMTYPTLLPNDYDSTSQYYLRLLEAPRAWDISTGSPDVIIAVVDAAILTSHSDLAANMYINRAEVPNNNIDDDGNGYIDDVLGWDVADNDNDPNPPAGAPGIAQFNHGTLVSGSAAASTNNNIGIAGLGYNCKIMPVKIKEDANTIGPSFTTADAILGVEYAVINEADVVNMSFGGGASSATFQALVNEGTSRGIVFVAAAGNDGMNLNFVPASYDNVISVASTNSADRKSGFSNFGTMVDVSAPGSRIRTTSHFSNLVPTYTVTDGTSFSSPIVSGLVGLMKSVNPCLTPAEIETILKNTSKNIDNLNPVYAGLIGAGRVNAANALRASVLQGAPSADMTVDSTDLCEGIIQCFYEPTLPNCADSISWTVNGVTSQSFAPVFQFDTAGTYTINLFVKNALGSNQTSRTITMNDPLLIYAGGDENDQVFTCFGQPKQILATSNTAGATYRWSPPVGFSNPNDLNPILMATGNRTYTLTATALSGCTVSKSIQVVLAVAPTVNAGQDESIKYLDSVQLNPTFTGNGLTYLWSPGIGLSDSTVMDPFAKPAVTTRYSLTITDVNGCTDDDKLTVNVSGVGIEDGLGEGISLRSPAPNPALDKMVLGVELDKTAYVTLTVFDLQGKKVMDLYNGKTTPGNLQILWNKEGLHAGMYLLVWQVDGRRAVQKVMWN